MSDTIRALRSAGNAGGTHSGDEHVFQKWYKAWAGRTGLDLNPDAPEHHYDYRAAWRAGVQPEIDPHDNLFHWPSPFKHDDHPNRFINGVDTKTGERR